MMAEVSDLDCISMSRVASLDTTHEGEVGLLCSRDFGDFTDDERCSPVFERCIPALKDSALKDFLGLEDLFAPYLDEKLSDGL